LKGIVVIDESPFSLVSATESAFRRLSSRRLKAALVCVDLVEQDCFYMRQKVKPLRRKVKALQGEVKRGIQRSIV
jgi:hypothetical protein